MDETISRPDSICPEVSSIVGENQFQNQLNLTAADQQNGPESINYQQQQQHNMIKQLDMSIMSNYSTTTSNQQQQQQQPLQASIYNQSSLISNNQNYNHNQTTNYQQLPSMNSTQLNNNLYNQSQFVNPNSIQQQRQQQQLNQINQTMHQPTTATSTNNNNNNNNNQNLPNTSVYARSSQVQSYPYSNYSQQQQPQSLPAYTNQSLNYNQLSTTPQHQPQPQQYGQPITSSYLVSGANFMNPSYNIGGSFYSRAPQFSNSTSAHHHLNSSLHQPHSIDLNDSLSRSFNGVPSNFALLNPPPLLQALPFLTQNNQLSAQIQSWLTDYHLWQETVKRNYALATNKNLIPLKYEKNHSSIRFGNANLLITVNSKSIFIQKIKPVLIEYGENTLINTWPGPLIKEQTNKNDVIEYIKGQEKIIGSDTLPEYHYLNQEKSQIWQLLSMMIKQNGDLSSSELAEFLITKNESEFYTDDGGTELGKFRRFLLLGQKKNALDYARKVGLWGHTFALAYLISNPQFNEIMINSVNDFTDSTLSKDDPIFTLYRRLMQNLQKSNPKLLHMVLSTVLPPSNLQQFTILLANNCEISPVLPGSAFVSEVLKLIVALRDGKSTFIDLNSLENFFLRNLIKTDTTKYSEELLFMNEIFEFCQKSNLPLIEIIPFKAIFAAKLYDYGLISQSKKYCEIITNVYKSHVRYMCYDNKTAKKINWPLIMYIVELIESKIDKVLNDTMIHHSYLTTPLSNEENSRPLSSPDVDAEDDDEEEEDISNELDSELENLHLNSEKSNRPLQTPQQQQQSFNKINRNQPFIQQQQQQQQTQFSQKFQPPQQNLPQSSLINNQQRERSDSVQSRQRTTSRTSSNLSSSNFANQSKQQINQQQTTTLQTKQPPPPPTSQFNQQQQQKQVPLTVKTNDLSSLSSNNAASNLKSKNEMNTTTTTKPIQPSSSSQQPTFFVPKFSPNDNLPPIDFISKPIESTNLLEETNDAVNDEDQSNLSNNNNQMTTSSGPPPAMSNFNSNFNSTTLNPTMAQKSQNFSFPSPVSPITSPVLNANNQNRDNLNMNPNMARRLDQQPPPSLQPPKKEVSSSDQIDSTQSKKEEKSGLFDWMKSKIVPKGPNEAHLPDDNKNRFYYDQTLKRWIDTEEENNEENQVQDQIRAGPPKMPSINQSASSSINQINNNLSISTNANSNNFSAGPPQFDPSQFSFVKSKQKRYVDIFQQPPQ